MPNSNQLYEAIDIAKAKVDIIIPLNKLYSASAGKWITCGTVDKPKGAAGRFMIESDPDRIHLYNWQTGAKYIYFFNKPQRKKLTLSERKQLQQQINQRTADDQTKQEQDNAQKAEYYRNKFLQFKSCEFHPYADRKGLENLHRYNFKIDNYGNLAIPYFNASGIVKGYQTIPPFKQKVNKRFHGSPSGYYWQFPLTNTEPGLYTPNNSFYLLSEGAATGMSAYEAINNQWNGTQEFLPIILCSFGTNNINSTVKATKHNNLAYIYLVDNDASNHKNNAGIYKAMDVLTNNLDANIQLVICEIDNQSVDANDFILAKGENAFIEELCRQTNITDYIYNIPKLKQTHFKENALKQIDKIKKMLKRSNENVN